MIEALQAAVYTALSNDAAFNSAVGGRIYDKPPQVDDGGAAPHPYAVIGDTDGDAWATDDWSGDEVVFSVFAYSRYGGNKEAAQILDLARAALDRQSLAVSGRQTVTVDYDGTTGVTLMADGQTRVGEISFSTLLCP